jgi:hypothetical protein
MKDHHQRSNIFSDDVENEIVERGFGLRENFLPDPGQQSLDDARKQV